MGREQKIARTCHHMINFATETHCNAPSAYWYPAMGGGTAALCEAHGAKHFPHGAQRVSDPIWHGGGEPLPEVPVDAVR